MYIAKEVSPKFSYDTKLYLYTALLEKLLVVRDHLAMLEPKSRYTSPTTCNKQVCNEPSLRTIHLYYY